MLRYACLLRTSSTAPVSAAAVSTSAATAPASPVTGVLELSSAGAEVGASDEGETGASEETAAAALTGAVLLVRRRHA